jgi:hypothetical protein
VKNKNDSRESLIITPIFFISLDTFFTLYLQPKEYWRNYNENIEWSPIFKTLLEVSPIIFLAFVFLYIIVICVIILVFKNNITIILSFGLTILHSNAVLIWLINANIISYYEFILTVLGISSIIISCFSRINLNT